MCAEAELEKRSELCPQVERLLKEFGEDDLLEHFKERPSTAMADQLVAEEMARRRSSHSGGCPEQTSGSVMHPPGAKASNLLRDGYPTLTEELDDSGRVSSYRPNSALAEQLVSEEIARRGRLRANPSFDALPSPITEHLSGTEVAGATFERPSTALAEALVSEEIASCRCARESGSTGGSLPKLHENSACDHCDPARPSTAQAERLIFEEFEWRGRDEQSQESFPSACVSAGGCGGSNMHSASSAGEDFLHPQDIVRPSTAQAEQLVLEEIKSMVASGPWSPAATPIDTTRPSTAHAEQLVAEEIQQHGVQVAGGHAAVSFVDADAADLGLDVELQHVELQLRDIET